jgi:response regulator RpfG family c-di-GMP phosphodiesterase
MSAFGTIDLAIEALRRGAYDYISKPFKRDEVILVLRKAEEREQLRARVAELEEHVSRLEKIEGDRPLLGESEPMRELKRLLSKVAAFPTTVLITGESGTGKELVARAIHRAPPRRQALRRRQLRRDPRERCSRASSSATSAAPSPTPRRQARASSRRPTAARSSSTRSASCRRRCR